MRRASKPLPPVKATQGLRGEQQGNLDPVIGRKEPVLQVNADHCDDHGRQDRRRPDRSRDHVAARLNDCA